MRLANDAESAGTGGEGKIIIQLREEARVVLYIYSKKYWIFTVYNYGQARKKHLVIKMWRAPFWPRGHLILTPSGQAKSFFFSLLNKVIENGKGDRKIKGTWIFNRKITYMIYWYYLGGNINAARPNFAVSEIWCLQHLTLHAELRPLPFGSFESLPWEFRGIFAISLRGSRSTY